MGQGQGDGAGYMEGGDMAGACIWERVWRLLVIRTAKMMDMSWSRDNGWHIACVKESERQGSESVVFVLVVQPCPSADQGTAPPPLATVPMPPSSSSPSTGSGFSFPCGPVGPCEDDPTFLSFGSFPCGTQNPNICDVDAANAGPACGVSYIDRHTLLLIDGPGCALACV